MWQACLQLPDGREVCFPIPVLVWRWPWPEPDPDPYKWIEWGDEAVNPVDLSILATVNDLVSRIASDEIQGTLKAAVQDAAKIAGSNLPRGVELHGGVR